MAPQPFRAIIIGAGPVGLSLGHMLKAANLDFVILERHSTVVTESGAGIILWPQTTRIFDQLGLTDACAGEFIALHSKVFLGQNGKVLANDPVFDWVEGNHGYPTMAFPRPRLVRLLYEELKEHKSKVRTSVRIERIETDAVQARVHLQDGTVVIGSIVIGCDGVHSQTRDILQRQARIDGVGFEEQPPSNNYKCLYGTASSIPGLPDGVFWESHAPGVATQFAASGGMSYFIIFKRMEEATTTPHVFTAQETKEYIDEVGEMYLTTSLKIKDVEKYCTWQRLAYQPQGFLGNWYHGRIVLCGDATVQMTSTAGMGYNAALQSAVLLVNKLYTTMREDANMDLQTITSLFREYQEARKVEIHGISELSIQHARGITWNSWLEWIIVEYVIPWVWGERGMMKKIGAEIVSRGRKLSFVDHEDKLGEIPWEC